MIQKSKVSGNKIWYYIWTKFGPKVKEIENSSWKHVYKAVWQMWKVSNASNLQLIRIYLEYTIVLH